MSEREPMIRTPTTEPRIVRHGWYNAEYGCPEGDWAWHISSSDRLTNKRLHEDFRPRFDEHVAAVHPTTEPHTELDEALLAIADEARKMPDEAIGILRRNGLVIDKWPPADRPWNGWTPENIAALDPEVRWQGVAFTFYTALVAGPLQSRVREYDELRDEVSAAHDHDCTALNETLAASERTDL